MLWIVNSHLSLLRHTRRLVPDATRIVSCDDFPYFATLELVSPPPPFLINSTRLLMPRSRPLVDPAAQTMPYTFLHHANYFPLLPVPSSCSTPRPTSLRRSTTRYRQAVQRPHPGRPLPPKGSVPDKYICPRYASGHPSTSLPPHPCASVLTWTCSQDRPMRTPRLTPGDSLY